MILTVVVLVLILPVVVLIIPVLIVLVLLILIVLVLIILTAATAVLPLILQHLAGIYVVFLCVKVVRPHNKRLGESLHSRLIVL